MCESTRDKQLQMISVIKFNTERFSEGIRIFTNIHHYVQYAPLNHTNKFGLCHSSLLEMKASENPIARHRLVVLYKVNIQPGEIFKIPLVIRFVENSPLVLEDVGFNDKAIF